jgi:PIN domain nuclease of toxin-antitoxin system
VGLLRFLLDTHCWLWLKFDSARIPSPIRRRLTRRPDQLVLSSVCVMEMALKQVSGKLTLTGGDIDNLASEIVDDGVRVLDAGVAHMLRLAMLPLLHRDPFDRLLVAQALVEGLTLVSADPQVLAYDVSSLDVRK